MELSLSPSSSSSITIISKFPPKPTNFHTQTFSPLFPPTLKFPKSTVDSGHRSSRSPFRNTYSLSISSSSSTRTSAATSTAPTAFDSPSSTTDGVPRHWMVVVEKPPEELTSKPEIIDYYVNNLKRVLNSEKDAQKCIYNASCQTDFWFCCEIDEENALNLAGLPGVLSVEPDANFNAIKPLEFIGGNYQHWVVRTEKPNDEFITKSQAVDYYTQILTNIMQNEKEAQKCIYHVWWQSNFGFCCELDENGAKKLAGVPGVLSVRPDENFESDIKGENLQQSGKPEDSSPANQPANIKTKKLFITGLSFYTSEKTLRAAFESFGEIVEVKVIMDKISKRSKGYAFIEYTTEEAASAALKEMNGKIINGWMIVVDVAKPSANRSRRPRSTT